MARPRMRIHHRLLALWISRAIGRKMRDVIW
jgi:hypothetical protein